LLIFRTFISTTFFQDLISTVVDVANSEVLMTAMLALLKIGY